MAQSLAFLIKLIAAPRLSVVHPGCVRAHMGYLKLLGRKAGRIDVNQPPERPSERWVAVAGHLLPPFQAVTYDTGAGTVDLEYDPGSGDGLDVIAAIHRLVEIAADEAGRFLQMEPAVREDAREMLLESLKSSPIDMRHEGSGDQLRKLMENL